MHPTVPWPLVGKLDPAALMDTRVQAHHAVQLVVALGISLLPPEPDDSHTNLEWLPGGALAGCLVPGDQPVRGALRLHPLILMVLNESGDVLDEYRLAGRTLAQGFAWLKSALSAGGAWGDKLTDRRHYTIPDHPVARGDAFHPDERAARELRGYYQGANQMLTRIAAARTNASVVRCWPHHFDIATLITISPGRTIGAGLSPGDDRYAEPYYYVSPYPYPRKPLPPLATGLWNPTGWVGAVLPASHLIRESSADRQRDTAGAFLDQAIAVCEELV